MIFNNNYGVPWTTHQQKANGKPTEILHLTLLSVQLAAVSVGLPPGAGCQ